MFESSLTHDSQNDPARSGSLSVAVAMHLLALLPIAAISYLFVEDIIDPAIPPDVIFVSVPPTLTAPPDSGPATPERGHPLPRLGKEGAGRPDAPPSPPAPSSAPADLDALPDASAPDSVGEFGPGSDDAPYGTPSGAPDGFGADIHGVDPPGAGGNDKAIPVSPGVDPPKLITKVTPEYPAIARAAKIAGKVIVQATISTTGDVVDVSIVSSSSELLNDAALDAVRKWKYRPARVNGEPVAVYFTVRVEFSLQ